MAVRVEHRRVQQAVPREGVGLVEQGDHLIAQVCWHIPLDRSGDTEGAGIIFWGDSLGAISHIKLRGAFTGKSPVSLVPPCIPASWLP